ncbi:MAG TPA: hypothetical protein VF286_12710 [Acidiphilium sp.]
MPMICNVVKGKLRAMTGNSELGMHIAGVKPTNPEISTLVPMLVGGIVIVILGCVLGLVFY